MSPVRRISAAPRRSIDGGWEFARADAGSNPGQISQWDWQPTRAPGTAAGALRELGQWNWDTAIDFDAHDWWWRVRLDARDTLSGPALLGFDGLATLADVWLDGEHLLHSENMFLAHRLPVRLDGTHELLIRCAALAPELARRRPRPRWRVPMLNHTQWRWFRTTLLGRTPGWSPPCPPVGPWRPVWIEKQGLQPGTIDLHSRIDDGMGVVEVSAELARGTTAATLIVERDGRETRAALDLSDDRWRGIARVESPVLWWPHTHGEPACYGLRIEMEHADGRVDLDLGFTGFRRLEIQRDDDDFAVSVNGVRVFCRGACWTPLDVVSLSASPETYREAIAQVCAAGMNMLRVPGTMVYEDDAFLDALDQAGILLWQDLMFANMDYPEEETFVAGVLQEVDQQLSRLQARPAVALICGNSEGEQQAAMSAAGRELWSPALFHRTIAERVAAHGFAYTPSSAHGGAFPHAANAGSSSYYGVGAYLRPLEDARRSELVFASECLAFANIPADSGLPGGPQLRVHHPAWKARSPRDLGAGWDFDDVRDHYVARLFDLDPSALRASDHDRYLALGRVATGEVMAQAFAEWRRARSPTRGALVWLLRDLWPGAGWGLFDANGDPKLCLHALRRVLAPRAVAFTDEGVNGLSVHVFNDGADPLAADLDISLYRATGVCVGAGAMEIQVDARGALEIAASTLFEGFLDISFAYRFGPPLADVVHAVLRTRDGLVADAFWFPAGMPTQRDADVGLTVTARPGDDPHERIVEITAARFAQSVTVEARGFVATDGGFHLAPGQTRTVVLRAPQPPSARVRGVVSALNAEATARFDLP